MFKLVVLACLLAVSSAYFFGRPAPFMPQGYPGYGMRAYPAPFPGYGGAAVSSTGPAQTYSASSRSGYDKGYSDRKVYSNQAPGMYSSYQQPGYVYY